MDTEPLFPGQKVYFLNLANPNKVLAGVLFDDAGDTVWIRRELEDEMVSEHRVARHNVFTFKSLAAVAERLLIETQNDVVTLEGSIDRMIAEYDMNQRLYSALGAQAVLRFVDEEPSETA